MNDHRLALTERVVVRDENTLMNKMQQDGIMFDWQRYRAEILSDKQDELMIIENRIKKTLEIPEPFTLYGELISRQALKKGISIKSYSLEWLRDQQTIHPIFSNIVEWKERKVFLKRYGSDLKSRLDENYRLHPEWVWNGTMTNRIIARDPCVQNFPREVRAYFTAPPGCCLVSADYSQMELRIIAEMSEDQKLRQIFLEGGDLYKSVASLIFKSVVHDISDVERQKAKAITLGMLYGISSRGIVQNLSKKGLNITNQEANNLQLTFFEQFPKIAEFQRRQLKSSIIRTIGGQEYHKIEKPTSKLALGIQGSASEIFKDAIGILIERLEPDVKIVLLLHDEVVLEVKNIKKEMAKETLKSAMMDGAKEYVRSIPIEINFNER